MRNELRYKELYCNSKKLFYCISLLIIIILVTMFLKKYFKPVFVVFFIVYTSTPIYNVMFKISKKNSKLNGLLSILIVNFIIIILFIYMGNLVYKIKDTIVLGFQRSYLFIQEILINLNLDSNLIGVKIEEYYNSSIIKSNLVKKGAVYTTESIINYFIGNIIAYFILVDKYVILNKIKDIIPKNKVTFAFNRYIDIKNIIKLELTLVLITTFQTILGFIALNIENAVEIGMFCGFLDLFPYVGTIIVFLPLILYKILIKNYIIAFGLLCLYILLIINRNIMEAKFVSSTLKVHPIVIISSFYIGFKTFGILGIIIAPLYVLICKSIYSEGLIDCR
ncbi:AI-2E family transporter [Clostridium tetani]|uniref:AI-2E family transporter n=1 Tax=Clostridium tetani TaxID=1513 RepID=UPI0024339C93|nr:AI-2E family transporter [Clostridium tetani]